MLQTVGACAAQLRKLGVRPSQVVVPFCDNPAIFYVLVLALLRVGATAVCTASADSAVADGLFVDHAITLPDKPSRLAHNLVFDQSWFSAEGFDAWRPGGKLILKSSGTTGVSKYYEATPAMLENWAAMRSENFGEAVMDELVMPPMFSIFGLFSALYANCFGGTVFWPKETATATLNSLTAKNPVNLSCTPSVLSDLIDAAKKGAKRPNLGRIVLGGSVLTADLARQAEEVFGCPVINFYGSTESGHQSLLRVAHSTLPQGHVGKALPGVTFYVEDESGAPAGENVEGHVKVLVPENCRIEKVLIGSNPFDDKGRFISGDLGYLAASGDLVVTGRVTELINSSGFKATPERFEALARKFIAAEQIAAFGMANALGSEDIGLAVVCATGFDAESLKQNMQASLGPHLKVHVFKVAAVPLNPTGKIDRLKLRAQCSQTQS